MQVPSSRDPKPNQNVKQNDLCLLSSVDSNISRFLLQVSFRLSSSVDSMQVPSGRDVKVNQNVKKNNIILLK